jgi:glycosyltransferase involved in cell wall biosynthesis
VILPTFNRADTLPRSIGSVLEQQHKNLELIVVDDGSTDRTRELVANISDPRIRYIWVDRNRGQSAARNVGISIARAELVAFQDSDDLWAREKLTRQLQALLDDPRLAGVYCDLRRHQLDGAQFLIEAPDLELGAVFDRRPSLYQSYGLGIQTCILRKNILHDSGLFNEHLRCFEDLELLLRIATKHRLRRVPEPLVDYFETENSVSKNAAAERKARMFLSGRYGHRQQERVNHESAAIAEIWHQAADRQLDVAKRIRPRHVRIEASSFCQLRCPSCPTTSGHIQPAIGSGFLRFDDFRKLLESSPFVEQVEISNYGEVFLNPQLLPILEYAHQKNVGISIENGANLNYVRDEVLEGLVKFQVRVMTCSIDGATSEGYRKYRVRGNFDKVISNIEKINSYKDRYKSTVPKLVWQFVVFGHNEHEIPLAREMAAKLGMEFHTKLSWDAKLSPIRDADFVRAESDLPFITREEYEQEHGEKFGSGICHQLWDAPQINWDGRVVGCCRNFWGDFGGNAFADGLLESVNNEKITYAREMLSGRRPVRDDIPGSTCEIYIAMLSRSKFVIKDHPFDLPARALLAPEASHPISSSAQIASLRSCRQIAGQNFQTFWWGKSLSPYEVLCLKSFIDMGHSVTLYTYDTDIHVPLGVTVRDAGEIFARDHFFFNQEGYGKGLPNAFSNMFR